MKNELPIETVVEYRKNSGETGVATIVGYDVFHTKYRAVKHAFDGAVMPGVTLWLFENEVINQILRVNPVA